MLAVVTAARKVNVSLLNMGLLLYESDVAGVTPGIRNVGGGAAAPRAKSHTPIMRSKAQPGRAHSRRSRGPARRFAHGTAHFHWAWRAFRRPRSEDSGGQNFFRPC